MRDPSHLHTVRRRNSSGHDRTYSVFEVFDMVRKGDSRSSPGLDHDGEFFNVEIGVGFDFTWGPAHRATGFQFRAPNGMSSGRGARVEG